MSPKVGIRDALQVNWETNLENVKVHPSQVRCIWRKVLSSWTNYEFSSTIVIYFFESYRSEVQAKG